MQQNSDLDTLSTIEAARMAGMAVRSMQLITDRGEIEAWRTPGGHRRIHRESLLRWLAARGRAPVGAAPAGAARPKVLLIEDSHHFQSLISLVLRQAFPGLDLQVADDGLAGLALAGRLQPELLIVDILLPGIDGAALIAALRSQALFPRSRLVVVTSLEEAALAPYRYALHDVPIVPKSRLVQELPARVGEALQLRQAAP